MKYEQKTLEKFKRVFPCIKIKALVWWFSHANASVNASFFEDDAANLQVRRYWASLLSDKRYYKLAKEIKGGCDV